MEIRQDDSERNMSDAGAGSARRPVLAPIELDDIALVARLAHGDMDAFQILYDRFNVVVYSTALRVLGDASAAEDVIQEVFLRLWRRPERFDPERGRFVSWILSATRNRAIDELRGRGRRKRFETDPPEAAENSADPDLRGDPIHLAVVSEAQAAVRRALLLLPAEQRRALEMAYFGGMTQVEIAEMLMQPMGTIKTRMRVGMQKMRAALAVERVQIQ